MQQYTVKERRDKIIELLNKNGRVSVNELSQMFEVSNVIIRNDLTKLEEIDMLSRVHGGAITSYKSYYNMSLIQRTNINSIEKTLIAQKISSMIKDNDTIIMNAGTTPIFVMRAIMDKKVTILTNSIALALEGAKNNNFKIILLGGDVDSDYQFTYGIQVLKSLEQYKADTLIMSVDGVDCKCGFSTFYYQEAEICTKMINQSNHVIIAADSRKIGRTAFAEIGEIRLADTIVTDNKASSKYLNRLKNKGIEIVVA